MTQEQANDTLGPRWDHAGTTLKRREARTRPAFKIYYWLRPFVKDLPLFKQLALVMDR